MNATVEHSKDELTVFLETCPSSDFSWKAAFAEVLMGLQSPQKVKKKRSKGRFAFEISLVFPWTEERAPPLLCPIMRVFFCGVHELLGNWHSQKIEQHNSWVQGSRPWTGDPAGDQQVKTRCLPKMPEYKAILPFVREGEKGTGERFNSKL